MAQRVEKLYVCDFCGRNEHEVEHMGAAIPVYAGHVPCICNKCVDAALDLFKKCNEDKSRPKTQKVPA